MSGMNGGIMESQQAQAAAGYAPPALPFASLPPAASVPGQVRRASDLNNAVLISDGTYWSPLNGRAVLVNVPNANLTIQSLTNTLIKAVTFPGGFARAGSRFQVWARLLLPAVGAVARQFFLRAGPAGASSTSFSFHWLWTDLNSLNTEARINSEMTALGTTGVHRGVNAINSNPSGIFFGRANGYISPVVDFTAPWEIAFTGTSAAETAQTAVTATWADGVATFTRPAHGYATGDKVVNTLFDLGGYNGTLIVTDAPTADTWTAAIAADPGGAGSGGSTSRISNVTLVDYLIEWLQ